MQFSFTHNFNKLSCLPACRCWPIKPLRRLRVVDSVKYKPLLLYGCKSTRAAASAAARIAVSCVLVLVLVVASCELSTGGSRLIVMDRPKGGVGIRVLRAVGTVGIE